MLERRGARGRGAAAASPRRVAPLADRFCDAIDRLNFWVGRFWALAIFVVTFAVLYEVVARTAFGQPTLWSNETTVYLSAVAYLIGGGYALLYRRHVRIDLIYDRLSPRTRARLDVVTLRLLPDLRRRAGLGRHHDGLDLVPAERGHRARRGTRRSGRSSSRSRSPALLLLLQGIANLLRDLGVARRESRAA